MTATPGAPAPTTEDPEDFASLCDQARDLAENGHLHRAAELYARVADADSGRYRAQAALGLAVVRHDLGEIEAARQADRAAMATGHPEFAPRAAYHLALSYEQAGLAADAQETWQKVVEFGNPSYATVAHHGLARLAEAGGDRDAAQTHWQRALDGGAAGQVREAARDYGQRLLARGAVEEAARVIERGLAEGEDTGLRLLLGAVHVERAVGAFGSVATGEHGGGHPAASDVAAATELLAKLLALRGDSGDAAEVWERGLADNDRAVADEVRDRLRRGFLRIGADPAENDDPAENGAAGEVLAWWDPFVEAAVTQDSTPMLTGELFMALDRIYTCVAAAYAGKEGSGAALRQTVEEAVRMPSAYVWGRALHDDFRERLRLASGSSADVLPQGWPDQA